MSSRPHTILGIDPGSVVMGYALLRVEGEALSLVEMDVLKMATLDDHYERLRLIYEKVTEVIRLYKPVSLAIEAPFFGKNVQSMLKLGRAQGVAIAAAMAQRLPVAEYAPRRVKQAVTGKGAADKEQVWKMLSAIMPLPEVPAYYDASDALAVAVCHHFSARMLAPKAVGKRTQKTDWASFAAQNPDRLK